ncbi:MAG: tetratricopeptide repeat protein [Chromatiales bacterium]|nr:tetratricopeptide repeat protein [Chromatiales bacterium]
MPSMLHFFQELKRRHVIRVAAIYVAVGWVLAEVAGFAADTFGAPDWVVQMFTILILLGFPLVLIGAWAFEITPDGLKRDVAKGKFSAGANGPPPFEQSANHEPPSSQSIAVLPFVNMSSDPEQEYFSDGLSEELLNMLAQIPELHVAARTSSFSFKGKDEDIRSVAGKLSVANILEGSVRKAGDQVRVTAQLIKAGDGYHLWSETFDRTLEDIFSVQDEIAHAVVDALKISLLGEAPKARETSPEAYALYLQGNYFLERADRESMGKAHDAFERALELDPEYAPAWSGLSYTVVWQTGYHGIYSIQEGVARAREAGERALALDNTLAEAHAGMASIKLLYDWDWAGAEAATQRALDLAPSDAQSVLQAGLVAMALGRFDEAIARFRQLIALDPLRTSGYHYLGLTLSKHGRQDEAREAFSKELSLSPGRAGTHYLIACTRLLEGDPQAALDEAELDPDRLWREAGKAMALFALQRKAEADEVLAQFIDSFQHDGAVQVATIYGHRDEVDEAFHWLDKAYEEGDPGLSQILGDQFLKSLFDDPRWPAFLEKMSLPEITG